MFVERDGKKIHLPLVPADYASSLSVATSTPVQVERTAAPVVLDNADVFTCCNPNDDLSIVQRSTSSRRLIQDCAFLQPASDTTCLDPSPFILKGSIPTEVRKILGDFRDVFPTKLPDGLPPKRELEHRIDLITDVKPPTQDLSNGTSGAHGTTKTVGRLHSFWIHS